PMEDLAGLLFDQLHAGALMRASAHEERRPAVRDLERYGSERSLRSVAELLVASDPVLALVLAAIVVTAWVDRVALDRLALERLALGRPVAEITRLKIEIECLAVGPARQDSLRLHRSRLLKQFLRLLSG